MEETLRCRTVDTVIGEMRSGRIDGVAVRRLSLAAAESGALALLLRAAPPTDASTAATRWIVGAAPSAAVHGPGAPRFAMQLVRNRRGPTGSWILEWSDADERFILATHGAEIDGLARCDEVRRPIEEQRETRLAGGRQSRLARLMREMPDLAGDLNVPARGSAHAPTRRAS